MDDLLASIRKIIADDFGERPDPRADRAEPRAPRRPEPVRSELDADAELDAHVAGAVARAFDAVSEPAIPPDPGPYDYSEYETVNDEDMGAADDDGDMDNSDIMRSIASAIAAQRGAPRLTEDPAEAGWTPVVLSEPGLDTPVVPPRAAPARTADGNSPLDRLAALKQRLAADGIIDGRYVPPAATFPRQPAPKADAAEPLPSNVYRLDPDQRTTEMSETVAETQVHSDAQGNAFRRAAPASQPQQPRAESADDGLTSPRTRANVSQALDSLSRTVLTNNPRTVEDLVRDMVRPLLREWLEANLGEIVERQVRQEIERVSARGR